MKKLFLILALPLLLISCPKEEIEPEPGGELLAEADIGPAGGVLESDGIIITVPPEAFASTVTIQIAREEEFEEDFDESAASPAFRISGFPTETFQPVTIAIQYQVNLESDTYLAMGAVEYLNEEETPVAVYELFGATDSSGYLVAQVPATYDEPSGVTGLKSTSVIGPFYFIARAIYKATTEEGDFFKASFLKTNDRQKIADMVRYMDEAMNACIGMKMIDKAVMEAMVDRYGLPEVLVTDKMKPASLPYVVTFPPLARCALPENGVVPLERYYRALKIKINVSKTSLEQLSDDKLKSYAYLWVYRMVYYMYFGDRMDWFAYASAFWMQEKHTGTSDYSTGMFDIVGKSPFIGMEAGQEAYPFKREIKIMYGGTIDRNVELHGYGMFPFVKYLGQRYADDKELIIKIMKEMLLSGPVNPTEAITPAEAIINVLEEPEYIWWPVFFEK